MNAPDTMPRILFIEEVSSLIGKTVTTIRTCATNPKFQHLIPPPFKLPHSRRLAWHEEDVRSWIAAARPVEPVAQQRRGRPTKAEQVARAAREESRASAAAPCSVCQTAK